MLKTTTAVMLAGAIAAAVNVLSAPAAHVNASALAKRALRQSPPAPNAPGPICGASAPPMESRASAW